MPAYYDDQKRSWYAKFYYKDFTGKRKQKMKRGFVRKADALQYEREFLLRLSGILGCDISYLAGILH